MRYTPATEAERQQMLSEIGVKKIDDLYADVPKNILLKKDLQVGAGLSEQELTNHLIELSQKNKLNTSFLGAGYYNHYIPSAVDHIISRSEFYTSYTPYQAEISQGVLQALFEYQSIMCELTGQEVSNATMYDGSTALAEAAVMAHNITKRDEILVSDTLHPHYRQVLKTYCKAGGLKLKVIEAVDGTSSNIEPTDKTAAVIIQSPNFFGIIEDTQEMREKTQNAGALTIACVIEASSLALLKPPTADITCGEGQAFGNTLSFGGPSFGFLTTNMEHVRQMPGRLVGETADSDGKRGYVLTLQAREQHIRREKATSNICSNEALCALRAVIYLSLIGKTGLKELAALNYNKAEFAKSVLEKIPGVTVKRSSPTFNEFTIALTKNADDIVYKMVDKGFAAGFPLGRFYKGMDNYLLLAVTEKRTREEILKFGDSLEAALCD